jgi:hypothetical protein
MGRFAIATISVLVMVLVGAAPSGARTRRATPVKCPPASGEVLLANAQAEVYVATKVTGELEGGGLLRRSVIRGCTYKDRHSYDLGGYEPECLGSSQAGGGCGGVALEALAGPIVAYAEAEGSDAGSRYEVFVRDLRDGRLLHKVATGVRAKPSPQNVGIGPATAIVVKSNGAVAWIAENDELSSRSELPKRKVRTTKFTQSIRQGVECWPPASTSNPRRLPSRAAPCTGRRAASRCRRR